MKKDYIKLAVSFCIYIISAVFMRLFGMQMNVLHDSMYRLLFWGIVGGFLSLTIWLLGALVKNRNTILSRVLRVLAPIIFVVGFILTAVDLEDFLLHLGGFR